MKPIENNILYDVSAELEREFGPEDSDERNAAVERAWEDYNAQVLLDARKEANMTQEEVARKIGASKGYISRLERGLVIPTVATLYKLMAAMGLRIVFIPKNVYQAHAAGLETEALEDLICPDSSEL